MAHINKLAPKIAKWEGGYVNHPLDKGGCTNMGVTIAAYRQFVNRDGTCEDLRKMTHTDFEKVLRKYWDMWKADQIKDQQVAEILVDWVWGSGRYGITIPQQLIGVTDDGIVGPVTLAKINSYNPAVLHDMIWNRRKTYLERLVANNPSQKVFLKGWMNRLNDFKRKN